MPVVGASVQIWFSQPLAPPGSCAPPVVERAKRDETPLPAANAGVFFTTSRFTGEAVDAAARVPQEIALVDGDRLTALMMRHKVGLQVARHHRAPQGKEEFFAGE